jgi:hypothetical protein
MKKVLAVIVNYGTEQIDYLQKVVNGLKSFKNYDVTVIVNSNHVDLSGVTGVYKINYKELNNYQLLPITCRKTIWESRNDYDIFIYGENDHLFEEHHINKHLEYTSILPEDRIAGLIQFEKNSKGELFYCAYHADYHWEMDSVEEYEEKKFAHFTNLHQASFILTQKQLLKCGEKKDFTSFMGSTHYSLKCRTNTDIYQFCGMKKMICISEFYDNIIHHLPNIYIGGDNGRRQLGVSDKKMKSELKKLLQ